MSWKDVMRKLKGLFIIVYTVILLYLIYQAYQFWQTNLITVYLALIALWTTGVWALSRIIDWLFHENTNLNQEEAIQTGGLKQIEYEVKIKQEAEQQAKQIENHTKELKETIRIWQQKLPKIELAEETGNPNKFHQFDISFINDIETRFLFKVGDVFYHCDGLDVIWGNFKNSVTDYRSEKHKLFNAISPYGEL